jgi:thiaminase/transcriptional activator TenA
VSDYAELVARSLHVGVQRIGLEMKRAGVPKSVVREVGGSVRLRRFAELADWCRDLMDSLAEDLPASDQERLAQVFLTSSRYELKFWDMARSGRWPVWLLAGR